MVRVADPEPAGRVMVCGFCQREFREDAAQPTCQACPLSKACRFVRCPYCGYENPAAPTAPAWLDRIRRWAGGGNDP
jgi:predicted amidophosphoribosyltransferase